MARAAEDRIRDFAIFSPGTGRTELAHELGLPRPTVVSAVRRLLTAGELVERDAGRSPRAVGRPPRMLQVTGPATLVGLVRWDGTALRAACIDVEAAIVDAIDLNAPDPPAGIDDLHEVVKQVSALARRHPDHRLRVVVLSVPAPFLSGHGAPREHALLDAAVPFPVTTVGDVESALTEQCSVPVIMENDANLAALGELYAGAAMNVPNAIYLKVNDYGFGSALVVNGELARGAHGYAGELAHLQVDVEGPLCACGGRGCLLYQVRERVVASAQAAYDEPITFAHLPRLAADGDAGAVRMMRDIGRALGAPLAHLCTFLDPELLLVGGTLGPSAAHVAAGIRDVLAVKAPPVIADNLTVATSPLGAEAETRGAVEIARLRARRG
jgi:predicted NBD/HSP70 family sugar kinase